MTGPSQDNQRHGQAIRRMLLGINSSPANPFVLKGGTALMECYGLDRFSEDIDLDALRSNVPSSRFFGVIDSVCSREGYSWRKAKDTPTVRRAFVDYGIPERPLKIELSLRHHSIPVEKTTTVNGILTYTISELCKLKCAAYMSRDKIRDLFDVSFIADRYYDQLSPDARDMLAMALEYKDLDQFDYLVRTQSDPLIDPDQLEDRFLKTLDKAGLLRDDTAEPHDDTAEPERPQEIRNKTDLFDRFGETLRGNLGENQGSIGRDAPDIPGHHHGR